MNQFGNYFRLSIYGESHGVAVGIIIDGVPSGIELVEADFLTDLSRRKSGPIGTTKRIEEDLPIFISGVFNGRTTGAPLHIQFKNKDIRSEDYKNLKFTPRPGHADFTALRKYNGYNDPRGGGHFSGRLTLPLVAAGVIAKKIVKQIKIVASILEIGGMTDFEKAIDHAIQQNDSIGGIIECVSSDVPIGWGEPFFNSVESLISHLIFSIPAIKGIEFGVGFTAAKMNGSQHNDVIESVEGRTKTNNSGGINGGITNGNELVFRVVVKPTSSIGKIQNTLNFENSKIEALEIIGRHDVCIALRVPVVVEAITAIALAEFYLTQKVQNL
jgi:chorismate synthase